MFLFSKDQVSRDRVSVIISYAMDNNDAEDGVDITNEIQKSY